VQKAVEMGADVKWIISRNWMAD